MSAALLSSYSKGAYRSGEQSLSVVSRFYKPDATIKGCIYAHHAGGTALEVLDAADGVHPQAIAAAGYPVTGFDLGDPAVATGTTSGPKSWGNDNAITAMGSAKTFLQAAEANGGFAVGPGAATSKFLAFGISMGALMLLNYLVSLATPSSVCAGVALSVPVLDLDDLYQNNKGSARADIGAAYGVTFPTAIPNLATHSPAAYSSGNKAKLSMPIKIWAASDDPIASTTSAATTWAGTIGGNVTVVDLGAVGHSGTTLPAADLAAFIAANA